jgi:hypothetical protein
VVVASTQELKRPFINTVEVGGAGGKSPKQKYRLKLSSFRV